MLGKGGGELFIIVLLFSSLFFLSFYLTFFLPFYLFLLGINSGLLCSSYTASRTGVLGQGAVLYLRPFEARAGDPVRKELFRQQAAGHHSSSPWFAPSGLLQVTPPALPPGVQYPSGPVPSPVPKRRRRRR